MSTQTEELIHGGEIIRYTGIPLPIGPGSEWFSSWQLSEQAIPVSLNIVDTSNNINYLVISCKTIENYIINNWQRLDQVYEEKMFVVCKNRLHSDPSIADGPIFQLILKIIGLLVANNPHLFDFLEEFSFPELLIILVYIFERSLQVSCTNSEAVVSRLIDASDTIWRLLAENDTSNMWFMLHKYSTQITPQYDPFFNFLPKISASLADQQRVPDVLGLYEEILGGEYSNLSVTSAGYIEQLMTILLDFSYNCLSDIQDPSVSGWISFIWAQTIDYGPFFFKAPERAQFCQDFFAKMLEVLSAFVYDPTEFFFLLEYSVNFFSLYAMNVEIGDTPFQPQMSAILDMLLHLVETENPDFLTRSMGKSIKTLSKCDLRTAGLLYKTYLMNPTPGAFYLISNSTHFLKSAFSTICSHMLQNNTLPAYAGLSFIRKCSKYCQDSIPVFIELVFSYIEYYPKESAECLYYLSMNYPEDFINDTMSFVAKIYDVVSQSVPENGQYLISALLWISTKVTAENPNAEVFYAKLSETFIAISSEIYEGTEAITSFIDFATFIIENSPSGEEVPETTRSLFIDIFGQFTEALRQVWLLTEPLLQEQLCRLILVGFDNEWLVQKDLIQKWVENILFICPVPQHIQILERMLDIMPSKPIIDFIKYLPSKEDDSLTAEILVFLTKGYTSYPSKFAPYLQPNYVIDLSVSNSPKVHEAALQLLNVVVDGNAANGFAEQIMITLVQGMFNIYSSQLLWLPLYILLDLGKKYVSTSYIAQFILSSLSFQSDQALHFAYLFAKPDPNIDEVVAAAKQMIRIEKRK